MIRRYIIYVILCLLLLGMPIKTTAASALALDVKDMKVYRNLLADTLIADYNRNPEKAFDDYNGRYYRLLGRVLAAGGDKLDIGSLSGEGKIVCSGTKGYRWSGDLAPGDRVLILGNIKADNLFGGHLEISATQVSRTDLESIPETVYCMANGYEVDSRNMIRRSLAEGSFRYNIPRAWTTVEYKLPNVEGYHYKLGALDTKGSGENLFIFYVDDEVLIDRGDIKKTKAVQKAIIRNILDSVTIRHRYTPFFGRDFDMISIKADYATFASYSGNYWDPNDMRYRVEFLFLPQMDRKDMRCILYVYLKENHADDILIMLKNMEL